MSAQRPGPLHIPMALLLGLMLSPALGSCAGGSAGEEAMAPGEAADEVAPAPGGGSAASAGALGGREDPYAKIILEDPQGRTIRLGDFKGKVRLIDVWATWCGPCRMIIPHLNRLYDRYRDQGLVVIGVSADDRPADVVAYTSRVPIRYPTGMMNPDMIKLLGYPDALPTSYLVDRNGRLRRKFIGVVEPETIEREVRKFLEKP